MRGPPVGRQLCALLLVILSPIQAVVAPWDCTTYPYPIQIIKGTSDANYRTMQLNFADGDFTEIWQWTVDSAEQPTAQLNAQGYNTNDDIAYGLFSDSTSSDPDVAPGYFCRFSAVQNSAECLCQAPYWGNTATITSDGTYYLAREGGLEVQKLPDVHNIAYPVGSPVAVSSLSSCGFSNVLSGRGTGGVIDITAWGLTGADMEAAYGLPTDCTQCYMTTGIWTVDVAGTSTGVMQTWKPGGQNMADFIDFEYNSINYLIGLGTYDASVWIIKLDGAGDVTGYAYSRVVVDYTASTSSKRTMGGFGAGYRYGDRIYVRDPPHPHTHTHTTYQTHHPPHPHTHTHTTYQTHHADTRVPPPFPRARATVLLKHWIRHLRGGVGLASGRSRPYRGRRVRLRENVWLARLRGSQFACRGVPSSPPRHAQVGGTRCRPHPTERRLQLPRCR